MRHRIVRTVLASFAILFITVVFLPMPAFADDCGGSFIHPITQVLVHGTACKCGDTVAANHVLDESFDPVVYTGPDDPEGPCQGNGLFVKNGVTLNMNGNTIRGSGGDRGISPAEDPGDHITVERGKIVNFDEGVAGNMNNSRFSNLQFLDNTTDGVDIRGNINKVEKCVANRNGDIGVSVLGSENTVQNCRAEFNARGVWAGGTEAAHQGNVVTRNVLNRNTGVGAQVSGGSDITVSLNQMKFNGGDGLSISGTGHFVSRNVNQSNGGDGMEVSATLSTFDRNRNSYNGGFGILDTTGATTNTYTNNICDGNALGNSSPEGLCR